MAQSSTPKKITSPDPSRQVGFHDLLVAARQTVLKDALRKALLSTDPEQVKRELAAYVPRDAQKVLAGAGIRDEAIFPTPAVLEAKPTLVGYYRLLLGVSQKQFYAAETGMGPFKSAEQRGIINARQQALLPDFCAAMCEALAELVRRLSPTVSRIIGVPQSCSWEFLTWLTVQRGRCVVGRGVLGGGACGSWGR
jgi:hypothetical protein